MHSTTSESTAPPEKSTVEANNSTSHSNSPAIAKTNSPSTSLLTTTSKGKNSTPPAKKARPNSPPILLLTTKESSSELLNIDNMPVPKIGTTLKEEKKNLLHPTIPESQASPAKKTRPNSPPILLLTTKESSSELLNIDNMPVPKIGTTLKDEKKNLLHPTIPESQSSPAKKTRPKSPPILLPTTKESSSAVLDIDNMPVPKLGTTLKEAKNNFLHPTIPESQALLTLQNPSSSIPTIPPMPKTVDLPLIAPDKTSVKKERERNNAPFVECAANVCSTRNCKSTVTRLKHPNSSNKYKLKQYTCLKCYTSEKEY